MKFNDLEFIDLVEAEACTVLLAAASNSGLAFIFLGVSESQALSFSFHVYFAMKLEGYAIQI